MKAYKENPCRDCENRTVGCHTTCEVRAEWVDRLKEEQDTIYTIRNKERQIGRFVADNIARTKRRCRKEK